jgi:hypothetical protein
LLTPERGAFRKANETDAPNMVRRFRQPEAGGT